MKNNPFAPPPIYIDLDDVLCETAQELMHLAEREFGRTVVFDQISSFNIAVAFDLTPQEVDHTMRLMHAPEMLLGVAPMPNAARVLAQWAAAGHGIEIVTGRPPSTREASRAWLERHAIPYDDILFVDKYGREDVHGGSVPALTLEELRSRSYHLAVDDSPEMATFLARNMDMDVILFDRPWNRSATLPRSHRKRRVERCVDWTEILARFAL